MGEPIEPIHAVFNLFSAYFIITFFEECSTKHPKIESELKSREEPYQHQRI
jgi:hypothetical protein